MGNKNLVDISKMAHVGFTTNDRDKAMAIFCEVLGITDNKKQFSDQPYLSEVTGFRDCAINIGFVKIENDSLPLEILEYINPQGGDMAKELDQPGAAHLCFEIDDLILFTNRLENVDNGRFMISIPETIQAGPWKGRKGAFLKMPDGLVLEFLEEETEDGVQSSKKGVLNRLHHVGYSVSSIEKIIDVFCNKLGMDIINQTESVYSYYDDYCSIQENISKAAYISLPQTEFCIELLECRSIINGIQKIATNMVGNVHLCFLVDDIMSSYDALEREGISFVGIPGKVTAGVNEGAMAGYLQEPYELRCEFFQGKNTKID